VYQSLISTAICTKLVGGCSELMTCSRTKMLLRCSHRTHSHIAYTVRSSAIQTSAGDLDQCVLDIVAEACLPCGLLCAFRWDSWFWLEQPIRTWSVWHWSWEEKVHSSSFLMQTVSFFAVIWLNFELHSHLQWQELRLVWKRATTKDFIGDHWQMWKMAICTCRQCRHVGAGMCGLVFFIVKRQFETLLITAMPFCSYQCKYKSSDRFLLPNSIFHTDL